MIISVGLSKSVEGLKSINEDFLEKKGILSQDCNREILPKFPACQTVLQPYNHMSQLLNINLLMCTCACVYVCVCVCVCVCVYVLSLWRILNAIRIIQKKKRGKGGTKKLNVET